MTQIYRNASQVQAWLGQGNTEIEPAYQWLLSVVPQMLAMRKVERLGAITIAISNGLLLKDAPQKGLNIIFESPWFFRLFSRLWIVQEVTVNPSPAILWYGPFKTDFNTVSDFCLLDNRENIPDLLSRHASAGTDLLIQLRQMQDPKYYEIKSTTAMNNVDLLDLVSNTWSRQGLDPRDRIYALAGLADSQQLPYRPSYIEPVDVIYMDYAIHRIGISENLRILEFCRWTHDRLPGLPSWVPDWTQDASQLGNPWKKRENQRIYGAGGTKHGQYQNIAISRQKRTLTVHGVVFDRVHIVMPFKDLSKLPYIKAGVTQSYMHVVQWD